MALSGRNGRGTSRAGLSGLVSILTGDSLVSEVHAGGNVDLQPVRVASSGELRRIEIDTLGERAIALELFFRPPGTTEPLVVGSGEVLAIDEDGEESVPVFRPIPGNAQGSDRALNHDATITRRRAGRHPHPLPQPRSRRGSGRHDPVYWALPH